MIKSLQIVLIFIATISGVYEAHSDDLVVDSNVGRMIFSGLIGNGKPAKVVLAQVDPSPEPREQGPE